LFCRWNAAKEGWKCNQEPPPRKDFALFVKIQIIGSNNGFTEKCSSKSGKVLLFIICGLQSVPKPTNYLMTTGVTSGAGTTYPAGEPEFTLVFFKFGSCCSIFSFLCSILLTIVCLKLFVLFLLAIVLSVLLLAIVLKYRIATTTNGTYLWSTVA
jgi:hypothetical protein